MSTSMLFLELPTYCGVEKWSSRHPHKLEIVGSSPTPATRAFRCWQIPYRLGIASTSICEAEKPTHRHSPIELRPRKGAEMVWGFAIATRWQCGSYNRDGQPAGCTTEMLHSGKPKKRCYCFHLPKQREGYDSAIYVGIAQLVERRPSKSDVAGSTPVSHSIWGYGGIGRRTGFRFRRQRRVGSTPTIPTIGALTATFWNQLLIDNPKCAP